MSSFKLGIIGGTGLNSSDIIQDAHEIEVDTLFGRPSDKLICGRISGVDCVLLQRHDRQHLTNPSNVNYRANILALKNAGCHAILATTACGSLDEAYAPGHLVVLSDFIDNTKRREQTYFDGSNKGFFEKVHHIPMYPAFSGKLREILIQTAEKLNLEHHKIGTMLTIEGPRFSSRAESKMFQLWGANVINMTTCPEVMLARELGMPYASVALVTDYDCWREEVGVSHVDVESVIKMFLSNIKKLVALITSAIPEVAQVDWEPILADNLLKISKSVV
jgi:5'-methylthioadenosine phosphorylase